MIAAIVLVIYIVLCIVIGIITSKYVKTLEDFIVAGRRMGPWVVAFGFNTTALSGWLYLGVGGWVYREAFQAAWTLWGSGLFAVIASYAILGTLVRRFSKVTGSLTVPDMLEVRYYDQRTHILRYISAAIIFISTVIYIGALEAQLATAFRYVLGMGMLESTILGTAVIVIYCLLGGMLAAVWTDILQGAMMAVISITLLPLAFYVAGGLRLFEGVDRIAAQDPRFVLSPWASPSVVLYGISLILFASILSYMGQPQLLNKFMIAKSDPIVRKASIISAILQVILWIGVFTCGLAARVIWPSPDVLPGRNTELALPFLIETYLGPIAAGFYWGAVLAAMMSTADSLMIMAVSAISNDIYRKVLRPQATEREVLTLSRILTVIIGVLGVIIAFQPLLILWSTWLGWSGLAVFVVPILMGLYWRRGTREGAICSLVVSFIVGMLWFALGLHRYVHIAMPSLLSGFAVYVLVSYLTKEPPKEVQELVEKVGKGVEV
jgi:SSS family transporter